MENKKELQIKEQSQKIVPANNTFDPNINLTKEIGLEMVERLKSFNNIGKVVKQALVEGIDNDYAVIPGTKKPTLLQPGARKIALLFGLTAEYKVLKAECDYNKKFKTANNYGKVNESLGTFNYIVETTLKRGDNLISSGIGSASNQEKGKAEMNDNSVLKIAKKRSFVDAVLMISNISSVFSQDMEDYYKKPAYQNKKQTIDDLTDEQIDSMIDEDIKYDDIE